VWLHCALLALCPTRPSRDASGAASTSIRLTGTPSAAQLEASSPPDEPRPDDDHAARAAAQRRP